MSTTCPAIKFDNFKYLNNFTIIIKLIPNSYQLYNDIPVLLNQLNGNISLDDLKYNGVNYTNLDEYPSIDNIINTDELMTNISNQLDNILGKIKNSYEQPENNPTPECDANSQEFQDNNSTGETVNVSLQDNQGETILEVTSEIERVATTTDCADSTVKKIVEAIQFPEGFDPTNFEDLRSPDEILCQLPDSALKRSVNYTLNDLQDDLSAVEDIVKQDQMVQSFQGALDKFGDLTSEENIKQYYDDLRNSIEANFPKPLQKDVYLSIPIVTFDEKENIILQIRDKKFEVINLYNASGKNPSIDVEIDPTKVSICSFSTDGITHTLRFVQEGDPTVYESSIVFPKNIGLYCAAVDPNVIKKFCGMFLDLQVISSSNYNLNNYLNDSYKFKVPNGCLYFYDWHYSRVNRNLVYPLPNLDQPVKMFGNYDDRYQLQTIQNVEYTFMKSSYLDSFFCSRNLNKDKWSIIFWFNVEDGMSIFRNIPAKDYRVLIEDNLNKYSLEYDDYTKTFKMVFDGEHDTTYIVNKDTWYFVVLKYNREKQKITFNIRSIDDENGSTFVEDYFENQVIDFNLTNMLARFTEFGFEDFFDCKFGTLALFNKETYKVEEDEIFNQQKLIINQLGL